jgi:hypothetical protein
MNEPADMRNVVLSIIKTAPETGEKIMGNQQIIKTENVLVRVMINNHTDTSEYLLAQGVGTYDFIKV